MATENGDSDELLRTGGILSITVGVCLTGAAVLLALMVAHALGLWQPNLPYLAMLASLLPINAGHPLLIAASVVVVLAIVAIVAATAAIRGNDARGGPAKTGAILGIIAGACLAGAGTTLGLAVATRLGLWQPGLPYMSRLGALLPIQAGNPLFIVAIVGLALGIVLILGGISEVKLSRVAMALDSEGRLYGIARTPPARTESATDSLAATAPEARMQRLRAMLHSESAPGTAAVETATAVGPGVTAAQEPSERKSRANTEPLDDTRLNRAKAGFSTRRVPKEDMRTLVTGDVRPRAGDVVLARVERLRQHERIELVTGRKAHIERGDEIIIACGNRYASDQFEGFVPAQLGRANLIAAGEWPPSRRTERGASGLPPR